VPFSTTNQSAAYVKNAVSGLEITKDEKITSKVESRGVKQETATHQTATPTSLEFKCSEKRPHGGGRELFLHLRDSNSPFLLALLDP